MDFLDSLLDLSPPVALLAALNAFGYALKKSPLQNWIIPIALPILGGVLYPLISETARVSHSVNNPTVFNGVIGFLIGSAATGFNQALRQFVWRDKKTNDDTAFLKRDDVQRTTASPNVPLDKP